MKFNPYIDIIAVQVSLPLSLYWRNNTFAFNLRICFFFYFNPIFCFPSFAVASEGGGSCICVHTFPPPSLPFILHLLPPPPPLPFRSAKNNNPKLTYNYLLPVGIFNCRIVLIYEMVLNKLYGQCRLADTSSAYYH